MNLASGTTLGPYEIVALIGGGGMGEVYRAKDTKLGRDVALKILPATFTNDPERLARFRREAHVLASLNHPHIGAIYGLDKADGQQFLVLELVDGESLDRRIARGPIPVDDALAAAKQIAEALEAAHEKGIIHRDLKPANIALTTDGSVKVLDFGLAKATEAASGTSLDVTNSPTITSPAMMTGIGVILGTAAYMAPEQAKGRAADKRSDVWAFGCVLYEMLTGRRAFDAEAISDTLAFVLTKEPDWPRLPLSTPPSIRRLLRRCLEKDRKRRLPDVGVARLEVDDAQREPHGEGQREQGGASRRERLVWASSLVLIVVGALAIGRQLLSTPAVPEMRLDIATPTNTDPLSLAISPDGKWVVFVATFEGRSRLWLRSLETGSARPVPRTDSALYPFWSPDNRSVSFFADGKLQRIDIEGASVQTLATAGNGHGGTWNRDGTILFANSTGRPIYRVSDTGGEAVPAIPAMQTNGTLQVSFRFPHFLPDGHHFLFYRSSSVESRGVYVAQLGGSDARGLLDADAAALYASSGQLLFVRQGTLFAQNFNARRLELSGTAWPITDGVAVDEQLNLAAFSASASGPIVYRAGSSVGQRRQLVWFDRSGNQIRTVGESDSNDQKDPSMSPDGGHVALNRRVNGNIDVWLVDTVRNISSRFTSDPAIDLYPIWSPDGARIVFQSNRKGAFDLYEKSISGAPGSERLILASPQTKSASDISPDGRFLLYRARGSDPAGSWDIWAVPLDGNRKPFPVVQTNFQERDGQFSPDGKWIAYQSDESGRVEVYVQPFPGPGGKKRLSTNGGAQVRLRADGKELFYITLDGRLTAVRFSASADGRSFEAGAPAPLFAAHVGSVVQPIARQQYAVFPDGQQFLVSRSIDEAGSTAITMILYPRAAR
jgi:Tol biopolymer transport system component